MIRPLPAALALSLAACASSSPPPSLSPSPSLSLSPSPSPSPSPSASPSPASSPSADPTIRDLPATVSIAKAHADGQHYAIDVRAPASVGVGGTADLEVVIAAKDGFAIDPKFPFAIEPNTEPAGAVTFKDASLARDAGAFTKTEARFKAAFTGAKPGAAKIGGTVALSVCKQKKCVNDRIALSVPVTIR